MHTYIYTYIHAYIHTYKTKKGENYRKSFQETGLSTDSVWSAGQVIGLIEDVPTCKELIERMVTDAEKILTERLPKMVV